MLNLHGKLLKVATNNMNTLYRNEFKDRFLNDLKIMEILSVKLNFTFSVIHCNFQWGDLLPNNTWNGIIGKLVTQVTI